MRKLVAIVLLATACATTSKEMNRLTLGMSKAQVIAILGSPKSTGAEGDTETLNYRLPEHSVGSFDDPYFVLLQAGKVVRYGPVPRAAKGGTSCVTMMVGGLPVTNCSPN